MYRYLKRRSPEEDPTLPTIVPSLSAKDVEAVNDSVKRAKLETCEKGRGQYNGLASLCCCGGPCNGRC